MKYAMWGLFELLINNSVALLHTIWCKDAYNYPTTTVLYCWNSLSCPFTAQPCILPTKSFNAVKACSVNSSRKNLDYCLLCLDLTPLWHGHEHCGIETIWSGKTGRGQETEIRNRTAKTDAVGGLILSVSEWSCPSTQLWRHQGPQGLLEVWWGVTAVCCRRDLSLDSSCQQVKQPTR